MPRTSTPSAMPNLRDRLICKCPRCGPLSQVGEFYPDRIQGSPVPLSFFVGDKYLVNLGLPPGGEVGINKSDKHPAPFSTNPPLPTVGLPWTSGRSQFNATPKITLKSLQGPRIVLACVNRSIGKATFSFPEASSPYDLLFKRNGNLEWDRSRNFVPRHSALVDRMSLFELASRVRGGDVPGLEAT